MIQNLPWQPRPELEVAIDLALKAGAEIMKYFKTDLHIETKSDKTPVTEADIAADKIIVGGLRAAFPYPILSEETAHDTERFKEDYVWIVDPLDGTKSFVAGDPLFGVLIGLAYKNIPILGVVYMPATQKLYFAEQGKGAYMKEGESSPMKMNVSEISKPEESIVLVSKDLLEQPAFQAFGFREARRFKGFAAKALAIADGTASIYINTDPGGSEWDSCAPEIIVREAGGMVSDIHGNPLLYNQENPGHPLGAIVSNGSGLHEKVVKELIPKLETA